MITTSPDPESTTPTQPRAARSDAGASITLAAADLNPVIATLGQMVGLLTPTKDASGAAQFSLVFDWFSDPLARTSAGVKNNGDQVVALMAQLLGEVGGTALGIPVSNPGLLGTWYPINLPGSTTPSGLYAVAYELGAQQDGATVKRQVLGLGTLYTQAIKVPAASVGPAEIDVDVWGMLPLVQVGGGSFELALGAAGSPLSLGVAVVAPGGPILDVAGFSFAGVKMTGTIDVAAADPLGFSTVVLQLKLPGEASAKDRSLAQLADIGADELLTTAAALALGALGTVTGAGDRLQNLLPVLGLRSTTKVPTLGWVELAGLAASGGDVSRPFLDWFTALVSDGAAISDWLGSLSKLLGVAAPAVTGAGTRADPHSVPILSADVGTLAVTMASAVDGQGARRLYPGLAFTSKPAALGTSSAVLALEAALELGEFDLSPGSAVVYSPASLDGRVGIALRDADASKPLFQGKVDALEYTFGTLRGGVEIAANLQVIPHFELTGVQTPAGKYAVLDFTQPGQLVQTLLSELVAAIVTELSALLGLADGDAFGAAIAALIGLQQPKLPDGVTWPDELAPPLSQSQLLAALQDPVGAIGGYYGKLLATQVGGKPAFFYLVGALGSLLQQTVAPIVVTGTGTAADPWTVALSQLPIALVVSAVPVVGGTMRLSFGLGVAPPLATGVALDVTLDIFSLDLTASGAVGGANFLPDIGAALRLTGALTSPAVLGAAVQVSDAGLQVRWSPFAGLAWSMHAGGPRLVVDGQAAATLPDLDFDATTSLQQLVTQQAALFAPILVALLGLAVARTGAPAGVATVGLLGLLPKLGQLQPAVLPPGLAWPATMPVLALPDFTDPIAAIKAQIAGLFASDANARAALSLLAWAVQPAAGVPALSGAGSFADPFQVPLGFASGLGGRVWYDAAAKMLGLGLGRSAAASIGDLQVATDVRLAAIELQLGGQPLAGVDPVPSLALTAVLTGQGALAQAPGVPDIASFAVGVQFARPAGDFTAAPIVTLDATSFADYLAAAPSDQQVYLTRLNAAVQAVTAAAAANSTFQTVYAVLTALGLVLPRTAGSDPYGVNSGGWQGLVADPLGYLAGRATTVLMDPTLRGQFNAVLARLLGLIPGQLPPSLRDVPAALLEVLAAMGYVAPAGLGYAPLPAAIVALARNPVKTLTDRFTALVGSADAVAALIGALGRYATIPDRFGIFTLAVTDGRVITVGVAADAPFAIGALVQLSGAVAFDLRQLTVSASARLFAPAIGVAVVPDVQLRIPGRDGAANGAPTLAFTTSLAWGDGVMPSAPPLRIWPFDAGDFVTDLAAIAPVQALSIFVTQIVDAYILAPYPLAQVAFSALGLAFQDAGKRWHLKSLVGLLGAPLDWLLADGVLGSSGRLNIAQLARVLAAIPATTAGSGVAVAPQGPGIRVSGLPFALQIDVTADTAAQLATFAVSLHEAVTLGVATLDELGLGLSLGPTFQPGLRGVVTVSGAIGAGARVFASAGFDHGFTLAVGQRGAGNPVLQLLPFVGWKSLIQEATSLAIQTLIQQLTDALLTGLAGRGAGAFVDNLRAAGTALDVGALVTALAKITDPNAMIAGAFAWLQARVSPANAQGTLKAVALVFQGLGLPGVDTSAWPITFKPSAAVPLTVLVGARPHGAGQQLGLWAQLDLPLSSLLKIRLDPTGVGFDLVDPSGPIFGFGLALSVPIFAQPGAGSVQTGPELDLVLDDGGRLTLTLDPQGGGSKLARQLYPVFFGPPAPPDLAAALESWLLQVLVQVVPQYVSIVVLNTDTVKSWLNTKLGGAGPSAGAVLAASQLLVDLGGGKFALNSYAALSSMTVESFLAGFLRGLLATQFQVLTFASGGGVWLEPRGGAGPTAYGVRIQAPGLTLPDLDTVVIQLGAADVEWIDKASTTPISASPGISVYVPVSADKPDFTALQLNLVNIGVDIKGAQQGPLVDLARFRLGAIAPRALLTLDFAGGPAVKFGGAASLDDIGISLAPTVATGSDNAVAQNLLGADSTKAEAPDPGAQATNPGFAVTAAYIDQLYVNLRSPSGQGDQVWIPVQRSFGPLQVAQIGIGWISDPTNPTPLHLLFDGGVELAGLSVDLKGLSVGIPVRDPTDYSKYSLGLDGLDVSFEGGSVTIAGALLKNDPPGGTLTYDGGAVIQVSKFSIAALGSYGTVDGSPSLFIFAALSAPLGGPAAFFVTGFCGGFGYNRGLILPEPGAVAEFPLVIAARDPAKFFSDGLGPNAALGKLSSIVFPQVGSYWLAAGIKFTSFELINSIAILFIKFGREFEIDIIGASTLSMPPLIAADSPALLAYVEMGLVVAFKPSEGVVSVQAQLTPNSFVLSRDAKLTGGFAFFLWFAGAHAGDFVISLGGYHPAFARPDHYPAVPRLGLNWPISSSPRIGVSGDAYFALTPNAVMAGTHLSLVFEAGPLRAWLRAGADFLISWKPFYFIVDISISVGVSLKVELFGVSSTLSASLGATLHLEGPPVNGFVEVDWYVISFRIPIGEPATLDRAPYDTWAGFEDAMLPAASGPASPPVGLARLAAAAAPAARQQVLKLSVADGLLSDSATATGQPSANDGTSTLLVRPFGFVLGVDTVIPPTETAVFQGPSLPPGPAIGVRPMDLSKIATPLTIALYPASAAPASLVDADPSKAVSLLPAHVTISRPPSGAPSGLWATTTFDPDAAPSAAMVDGALMSVRIAADQLQTLDPIGPIPLDTFAYEQDKPRWLPLAPSPYPATAQLAQDPTFATLQRTLATVGPARDQVFQAIQDRGLAAPLDPGVDVLATWAHAILVAPPTLAQVGSDLAAAPDPGVQPAPAAIAFAATPALAPGRAPQLLGAVRRYQLGHGSPSPDGVMLPAARRTRARWVDAGDAAESPTLRALFAAAPARQAAPVTLHAGGAALWAVDPTHPAAVQLEGALPLRACAFDSDHDLLADLELAPERAGALPPGTAHVVLYGRREADAALSGWQLDTPLLKVNDRHLLGDDCLLRPQAALRLRRDGKPLRHGLLDAAEVLAGNRVQGARGELRPGWIETLVRADVRTVVVLVDAGADLPAVRVAGKTGARQPARHVDLAARSGLACPGGQALFFAVDALAGAEQHLGVLVAPRRFGQLRGVFASTRDLVDLQAAWSGHALAARGLVAGSRPDADARVTLLCGAL